MVEIRHTAGAALTAFVSDGCSGGLSAVWASTSAAIPELARTHGTRPPWENCCVAHDRAYHAGGPLDAEASFLARLSADETLRQCVINIGLDRTEELAAAYGINHEQVGRLYKSIAALMYRAVRLGGAPCTTLTWRWGFGWPPCR